MRWWGALFSLGLLGCVTGTQAVQRQMVAPLPAMPMVNFDFEHSGQLRLGVQSHPLPLRERSFDSGLGAPLVNLDADGMLRLNDRVAIGLGVEYFSAENARFGFSNAKPQRGDGLAVRLALQGTLVDSPHFAVDVSGTAAVQGLPVMIATSAPLTNASATIETTTTTLPAFSVALLPRIPTPIGHFFGGFSLSTSPDIGRSGVRRTFADGGVSDDRGHLGDAVVMMGLGYAKTFSPGLGLVVQAWLPLTDTPLAYNVMFGASVVFGLGPKPKSIRDNMHTHATGPAFARPSAPSPSAPTPPTPPAPPPALAPDPL